MLRISILIPIVTGLIFMASCSSSTSPGGNGGGDETTRWFVNLNASGAGTGKNWSDAFTNLSAAMTAASSGNEIWVAAGTYISGTTDRDTPVVGLGEEISLHGGFDGLETELAERDVVANPTILDGEDNAYHVVVGAGDAVLDGFTITGGNANSTGDNGRGAGVFLDGISMTVSHCIIEHNYAEFGAGIYANSDTSTISTTTLRLNETGSTGYSYSGGGGMLAMNSSITQITDCHFFQNQSARYGGGLLVYNSAITATRCEFEGNMLVGYNNGGGVYVNNSGYATPPPVFNDCEFEGNTSGYGAGMFLDGCLVNIIGCTFTGNIATMAGGAINTGNASPNIQHTKFVDNRAGGGGAIYFYSPMSGHSVDIFNCLFTGNDAITGYGGAMICNKTSPLVTNCTFTGNDASIGGGIYIHTDETPALTNCILWGNTTSSGGTQIHENGSGEPIIQHCDIDQDEYEGVGNSIRLDPLWTAGPLGNYYLSHIDSGQLVTSPCVDTGSDQASLFYADPRTTRTDDVTDSGIVDMGFHYPVSD